MSDEPRRPPFYAILFLEAGEGMDAGLYSEAVSTMASEAMMKPGFLGFSADEDADGRPVRVTYWETLADLKAWTTGVRDLLPYRIKTEDCLGPTTGCLWPWLDETVTEDIDRNRRVA